MRRQRRAVAAEAAVAVAAGAEGVALALVVGGRAKVWSGRMRAGWADARLGGAVRHGRGHDVVRGGHGLVAGWGVVVD